MVNVKRVSKIVDELALLKFFPSDENARVGLVRIVCEMIATEEQARWLVTRMLAIYREWPGVLEMRACFCSRFKPCDGINAYSSVYPDGIPIDPANRLAIEAAQQKLLPLPKGHVASADPEFDKKLLVLAAATAMPRPRPVDSKFSRALFQTLTAPQDRPEVAPPSDPMPRNRRMEIQAQIDAELRKQGRL